MSKDCCKHDSGKHVCCCDDDGGSKRRKIISGVLAGFAVLVILVILIVWATLRPSKPSFILQDATLFAFNVSSPPSTLTTNMEVTLSSHNPNHHIGIYYDRLDAHASYRDQQITLRTHIGNFLQGHKDTNVWSPFLYGNAVPVAPYYVAPLCQDQASGIVKLVIKVNGRLRWKVGSFISGGYHVHVTCNAYASFGNQACPATTCGSVVVADGLKYQLARSCTVSV